MKPGDFVVGAQTVNMYVGQFNEKDPRSALCGTFYRGTLALVIASGGHEGEEIMVLTEDGRLGWTWEWYVQEVLP